MWSMSLMRLIYICSYLVDHNISTYHNELRDNYNYYHHRYEFTVWIWMMQQRSNPWPCSAIKNKLGLGMKLDNKFRIGSGAGSLVKAPVCSGFGLVGVWLNTMHYCCKNNFQTNIVNHSLEDTFIADMTSISISTNLLSLSATKLQLSYFCGFICLRTKERPNRPDLNPYTWKQIQDKLKSLSIPSWRYLHSIFE